MGWVRQDEDDKDGIGLDTGVSRLDFFCHARPETRAKGLEAAEEAARWPACGEGNCWA